MRRGDRTTIESSPDSAKVYIHRNSDIQATVAALEEMAASGDERATDILQRNTDDAEADGFFFESHLTRFIVCALAKHGNENENRPAMKKRVEELIGSIAVTASKEFEEL